MAYLGNSPLNRLFGVQAVTLGQGQTAVNIGYTPGVTMFFKNGALLHPGADYTATDGSVVTLANPASAGDVLVSVSLAQFAVANALPLSGGTLSGPLSGPASASESLAGLIKLATTAQAQALVDDETALTPKKLGDVTATETRRGITQYATNAQAQGQTVSDRAITPANLGNLTATETRQGLVEIATPAEAQAMTDDQRALTPKKLADAFKGGNSLPSGSGWIKFPNGIILQWLTVTSTLTVSDYSLPTPFPNAAWHAWASGQTAWDNLTGASVFCETFFVGTTRIGVKAVRSDGTLGERGVSMFAIGN